MTSRTVFALAAVLLVAAGVGVFFALPGNAPLPQAVEPPQAALPRGEGGGPEVPSAE